MVGMANPLRSGPRAGRASWFRARSVSSRSSRTTSSQASAPRSDEALEASLPLQIVDAADPVFHAQMQVTREVLEEIGAGDVPWDPRPQQDRQGRQDRVGGAVEGVP